MGSIMVGWVSIFLFHVFVRYKTASTRVLFHCLQQCSTTVHDFASRLYINILTTLTSLYNITFQSNLTRPGPRILPSLVFPITHISGILVISSIIKGIPPCLCVCVCVCIILFDLDSHATKPSVPSHFLFSLVSYHHTSLPSIFFFFFLLRTSFTHTRTYLQFFCQGQFPLVNNSAMGGISLSRSRSHRLHRQQRLPFATVTTLALLLFASASAASLNPTQQLGEKVGEEGGEKARRARGWEVFLGRVVTRRRLTGPGSSPPTCRSKCGRCNPCKPVHVPIQPGLSTPLEYYPEAWRCKCGNKLFIP